MEQNINLLISGKNSGASLTEFLAAMGFEARLLGGPRPMAEALETLAGAAGKILLMGTTHHGQHLLLEDRDELLGAVREKRILTFTRARHTDALAVTLGDESGISWYNYYRDGKMQRSVTFEDAEPDETGRPIPFEKNGVEPHKVLAAYCDNWKNLQKLEWEVFTCRNFRDGIP